MIASNGLSQSSARASASSRHRLDLHVHMVGNGGGGTGCWLRRSWWQWPFHAWLVKSIGLPASALHGNLEGLYAERLRQWVRESSLDAVVLLAQDRVYDAQGARMDHLGTFYVPNDYVLALAKVGSEFLPGVSIHPARPDAMDELEKCLAGGAALMKCLPNCQNIDCADTRFTRFWERMAAAGLPLLAHTGGEFTVQVVRPEWGDPRRLALPLECGVKVIAAHCATRAGLWDPQYFKVLTEMMRRYPNLFGDTSAFLAPSHRCRGDVLRTCLSSPIVGRLLHGSDYPVAVWGHWAWARGAIGWRQFRRWQQHPNPLERDYQLKRALGFPETVFTRASSVLRLA